MNVPRLSATSSLADLRDLEFGQGGHRFLWVVVCVGAAALLGVELDDQLLLDGRGDLAALGQRAGPWRSESRGRPGARGARRRSARSRADDVGGRGAVADRDHVVGPHLVGGDVDAAAVDLPVAVADQLARLAARGGEAEPDEHVVEAALEQPQQVLAGDAGLARGLARSSCGTASRAAGSSGAPSASRAAGCGTRTGACARGRARRAGRSGARRRTCRSGSARP